MEAAEILSAARFQASSPVKPGSYKYPLRCLASDRCVSQSSDQIGLLPSFGKMAQINRVDTFSILKQGGQGEREDSCSYCCTYMFDSEGSKSFPMHSVDGLESS